MKIAVCVKEVPDSSAAKRLDPATKRLVRDGDQVLNSFDTHAIEAALQLREGGSVPEGSTITAVIMAPETAGRTLQKALALGADDAIHIADPALAGSDIVVTARVLAAAISRGGFDLVLLGQQAGDSDCWVLPSVLAEVLKYPVITQASKLTLGDGKVYVERQSEHGYEKLAAPLPAVVTVSDALNEPRYPSLKAIMGAKKKTVELFTADALGFSAAQVGGDGSLTAVLDLVAPPQKDSGEKIEDEGGSSVSAIVDFLAEKSFI